MVKKHKLRKWTVYLLGVILLFQGNYRENSLAKENECAQVTALKEIVAWERVVLELGVKDDLFLYEFVENAGSSATDWYAFSMGRSGYQGDYEGYVSTLSEKISKEYKADHKLSCYEPTDLQRMVLTIGALGGDVSAVGKGKVDLFQLATYRQTKDNLEQQGLNAKIWALITMHSFEIEQAKGATISQDWLIASILNEQNEDGSYAMEQGEQGDVDLTAMALQAFSGCQMDGRLKKSMEKSIDWLSKQQSKQGGFASWGQENVESSCQVLIALCMLGRNCTKEAEFVKNGHTILDAIESYKRPDGGYAHIEDSENSDGMAGQQVFEAYTAYVRLLQGKNQLFDLREEEGHEDKCDSKLEYITSVFEDNQEEQKNGMENEQIKETNTMTHDQKNEKSIKEINKMYMEYFQGDLKEAKKRDEKQWRKMVDLYKKLSEEEKERVLCFQEIESEMTDKKIGGVKMVAAGIGIAIWGLVLVGLVIGKGRRKRDRENSKGNC